MSKRTPIKSSLLTTKMAAEILGITQDYVRHLITHGKLQGEKLGHDFLLTARAISKFKRQRKLKPEEDDGNGQ
jgi:excisionase family DNA binding protein